MIILQMEPDEITAMYREAKNKFKQVQILAEMNCVSNREMAQWLEEHEQKVDTRYFPERRMRKKEAQKQTAAEPAPVPDQTAKADAGKPRLTLVPMQILWDIAAVREFGCIKYAPDNWKTVEPERLREALLRHVIRYMDDPDGVDDETGLPHLSHVACNVAFLCAMRKGL